MNNPSPSDLAQRLARLAAHFALPEREEEHPAQIGPEAVQAREIKAARGRYWLRSIPYLPSEPWGETVIESQCEHCLRHGIRVPFNDPSQRLPISKCLFIDCETTGLSGGAGTVAFLTAIGQFTDGRFVVDQYFLPDLADEGAALDDIARRVADAEAIVSYNGSSFDLPLLEGRFNFWRIESNLRELPHLDLLWPTRAIFKQRIQSCTLSNVEEQLLRLARVEDLPGAEVPEVYFEYLRNGFSPRLHAVFEHNRLDVVSLFVYALWLDQKTDTQHPALASPDDLQALAQLWCRHRQHTAALAALDEASLRVMDADQRGALHRLRGRLLKRSRDYELAHGEWEKAAATAPGDASVAEELAKHLEHRRRDYNGALEIVEQAIASLEFRSLVADQPTDDLLARLRYRRARLIRKSTNL